LSTTLAHCDEATPEYGYLVCDACLTLYPIAQQIVDMVLPNTPLALTLAGWSNQLPLAPYLYERFWRQRALTLMTGEDFPVEREVARLNEWTALAAGELALDLGTSTGLYARGLDKRADTTVFAIDAARGMLREARRYIRREGQSGIVLMRALAEQLPFHDESLDAVVVGGSLNEFRSMFAALQEAYRVTRRGGRMFVTSLSEAAANPARWIQRFFNLYGIQFPPVAAFNRLAEGAGWSVTKQELYGIVLFTLLEKPVNGRQ
jgi:ubiquinone/menaquinone biosynthesis C-methylase UbiE